MYWFSNMESARAIVNVGIKTVFVKNIPDVKINDDVDRVKELFYLCKVKLMSLDKITNLDFPKRKRLVILWNFVMNTPMILVLLTQKNLLQ